MYRALLLGVLFAVVMPLDLFADGPREGAKPPDFGVWEVPPPPAAGEAASGWIFLSHPHTRFWTSLYHLPGESGQLPEVCLWSSGKTDADVRRAFDRAPRLDLQVNEHSRSHFVSVASGDILPVNGRLVKFERAEFPADYPRESIPKNVMTKGLRWTDVTGNVPMEFRPGSGSPLIVSTPLPEKQSGQHRSDYNLFPDPDRSKPIGLQQPFHVRVAAIEFKSTADQPWADIMIISKAKWRPVPGDDLPRVQEYTVHRMFIQAGQSIWHDQRAHRVLKIVPSQNITGVGNLIGWVEVESRVQLGLESTSPPRSSEEGR